ncbi:hypothetical protein THAOC_18597 [Thalassiosira oceanica]|uniref:Uncharacterized protein n=1 Tax=Thalassiosira oceanica TaxID=159749 RepID=K0S6R4_THAOC|nr:hypothetical protein THAOC_18597 [Thalassiosira oceanica]|eukprot:EJK60980.1 hypothetical protein THAOC_18597 [Thalassiosira oceanica]
MTAKGGRGLPPSAYASTRSGAARPTCRPCCLPGRRRRNAIVHHEASRRGGTDGSLKVNRNGRWSSSASTERVTALEGRERPDTMGLDVLSRTDCWRRRRSALSPGAASTELLSAGACEAVAGTATRHPDELAGTFCCADAVRLLGHHDQACVIRGVADSDAIQAEERHIPEHLVAKSIHSEGFQRRDDYEELPMSFCHDSIRLPASSASSSKTSSLDGVVDGYGPRLDGRAEVGQVWSYFS